MIIDDYDKVYALWTLCKGMGLNDLDDSKEGIERFLNRNPDTCFVAVNNGRIQGVILAGNDGISITQRFILIIECRGLQADWSKWQWKL